MTSDERDFKLHWLPFDRVTKSRLSREHCDALRIIANKCFRNAIFSHFRNQAEEVFALFSADT